MIQCPDDIAIDESQGFKLQELDVKNEVTMHMDEIIVDKLRDLHRYALELKLTIVDHPAGVLQNDVTGIRKLHEEFLGREKMKFYREMYEHHLPEITAQYEQIIDKVSEKNALECREESIIALFAVERGDFVNVNHHRFAVDYLCRDIWNVVQREIEKK